MTHQDDFDTLTAPARGRAGSEAVRVYENIKRNALTEMAGVLSGFWGGIEEQVRLAALAGHDYSANQDDRVAILALHQRALELANRYRQAIEREFDRWVADNIGLTYDTFTSSVLLLQGKAEKLLDSKPEGDALPGAEQIDENRRG